MPKVPFYKRDKQNSYDEKQNKIITDNKFDSQSPHIESIRPQIDSYHPQSESYRHPIEIEQDLQNQSIKELNSQISIPADQMLSFDHILQDIGFGTFQLWVYLIMGLLGITEGSQITLFTLMMPILKNEWGVSDQLNSLQASFVFIGFLFGSMLSGQFSDRIGRRRPFLYSSFFTTLFSFSTVFCQEIYSLLFLRGLIGVLGKIILPFTYLQVGFFAPCGVTMLSEITPVDLRGRYMGLITLTFAAGQLYGLFIASFTLDSLSAGNWRAMTFWCCLPGLFAYLISFWVLQESARFQLLSGKYDDGFEIINKMNTQNKGRAELNKDNQTKLINWVHSMNRISKDQQNASISSLFENNRFCVTCLIWFNWFTLSFMYYGIVLLLPYILSQIQSSDNFFGNDKLLQLVISCISDIIGAVCASFFIEIKGFGRKNSLVIFFFAQSITSILAFFDLQQRFIFWATLSKFFLSMTFIFSFQYTAEIYPTKIRTTGVGMANGIGRLGGVIMPWVCMFLCTKELLSPFILFSLLSVITSFSNFFLPYDTMGKELNG